MDTTQAIMMGQMNRNKEMKVFDFEKFYNILIDNDVVSAIAGLEEDLEYTSDVLVIDGKIDCYHNAYLKSTWATPILMYKTKDNEEHKIDCYVMEKQAKWDINEKMPRLTIFCLNMNKDDYEKLNSKFNTGQIKRLIELNTDKEIFEYLNQTKNYVNDKHFIILSTKFYQTRVLRIQHIKTGRIFIVKHLYELPVNNLQLYKYIENASDKLKNQPPVIRELVSFSEERVRE